jgi:hypothetical protein
MTQSEIDWLAFSGIYITYEQVLRFLMDYIDGDNYYKVRYDGHNLVRTHAQYKLLTSMEEQYDRMYYSYADKSFTRLTKPQPLFDWGYATIDADINYLESDGLYHMLIKKEGGKPGIYTATAPSLHGPWGEPIEDDYVDFEGRKKCEGSSAFQLMGDDTWRVAYIEYSSKPKNYRICKADKYLRNFSDPVNIEGVTGPQHGSFMRLTKKEYKRLQRWSQKEMQRRME